MVSLSPYKLALHWYKITPEAFTIEKEFIDLQIPFVVTFRKIRKGKTEPPPYGERERDSFMLVALEVRRKKRNYQ